MKFLDGIELDGGNLTVKSTEVIDSTGKIDWSRLKNTPSFLLKTGDTMTGTLTVPNLIAQISIPSSSPPSAWPTGFVAGNVYNNGYPVRYGTIFSYKGTCGNSVVQLLQAWPGNDGGEAYLYIRSARDLGADTFGPWRKVWSENNDGAGSGLDADLLDGIDSTGFLRRNVDTDTTGKITITRDGDAIVLNKNTTTSYSGITFNSKVNLGSDCAYIRYYDDVSNFYAPYDNGSHNENSALVIGVENDGVNSANDYLVLRGPTKIILDAFASSGPPERVAEFRKQGTVVSYIDNSGKYNGDVSSNQVEVKSTSTSNKFVIDFNETENSLDFIYT